MTDTTQNQYLLRLAEIILRIESSRSRSARERIINLSIPGDEATVVTTDDFANKSIIDMSNGGGQQQAVGKVQPLGAISKDGVPTALRIRIPRMC